MYHILTRGWYSVKYDMLLAAPKYQDHHIGTAPVASDAAETRTFMCKRYIHNTPSEKISLDSH
jgi:hypothetical protein